MRGKFEASCCFPALLSPDLGKTLNFWSLLRLKRPLYNRSIFVDPLYYKLCLTSFLDNNLEDVLCGLFIIYSPSVLCYIFPLPVPSLELGEVHTRNIQQVISVVLDPLCRRVPLSQPVLHCLHHSHHFAQLRGAGPGGSRTWSRVRYLPLSAVSLSRATFLDLLSSSSTPRR